MACDERLFVIRQPCQSSSSPLDCLFALLVVCFEYTCLLEHVYTAKFLYLIQNANGRAREVKFFPVTLKTLYGFEERGVMLRNVELSWAALISRGVYLKVCGVFNPIHWTFSLCLTSDMEFSHLRHV